ncbi:hypothetical protein N7510_006799 [Penicillium lagena]|uniref:uncharacterized protein n=1 Tax=Penicillium lagena TaxID=94218 RepID=UPI00253F991F|nr:uncharacterized protein N7510_006799 [Penicillium lagena]KAJ5610080.1 hypothetical protein N7510_006799 [Penicillium lagena]
MDIPHDIATCPLCPFSDADVDFVAQHIELCHPETGPAFAEESHPLSPAGGDESAEKYIECPHGCGETVTTAELSIHLDLHIAEGIALEDGGVSQPHIDPFTDDYDAVDEDDPLDFPDSRKGNKRGAKRDFLRANTAKQGRPRSPPQVVGADGVRRLGRAELGPHAHEKKMPSWLRKMLEKGGHKTRVTQITPDGRLARHEQVENETEHLIPVLSRLCEQDKSVQRAFLSSPKVRHICKMPREGGFCGYRNIQMLISYIIKTKSLGHERFPERGPTILDLQDMIEQAWDMGFNSTGRSETGGIRGTRKFIGTPEAQALLLSLGIQCEASSLTESKDMRAYDALYMDVASYYRSACSLEDEETKVFTTDLPPVYFQHQGHSMTIVGFEIRDNGSANLLVFDPMFKTSPAMNKIIGNYTKPNDPARLLKAYRRGTAYLQKYKHFELLKLSPPICSP